ncbi:hypothetical protein RAS1_29390 [Phycisphaerae bacterium RAS1]|nr:hypothetical protein RAS1_29390 [Phycisphaerae bacterium RAS1]
MSMVNNLFFCIFLFLLAGEDAAPPVPAPLIRAVEARRAIVSGQLEWTLRQEAVLPGREFRFETRYAFNGDRIFRSLGDQDGWVEYDLKSREPRQRFPLNHLTNADGAWRLPETSVIADYWPQTPGTPQSLRPPFDEMRDPRGIGLAPHAHSCFELGNIFDADANRIAQELNRQFRNPKWQERQSGERIEVTALLAEGGRAVWIIDPRRDWCVEECSAAGPEGDKAECVMRLQQIDGHWFPVEARFLLSGMLTNEFKLTAAAINRPDDRGEFGPNDIGMEPGFNISWQARPDPNDDGPRIWDGDRMVPSDTWAAAVDRGEKKPGATLLARRRGEHSKYLTPRQLTDLIRHHDQMHNQAVSDRVHSAWHRHTLDVCERFALDDSQRQKAMDILADCQEQAGKIMSSIRDDLVRLQVEMAAARRKGESDKVADAQRRITEKTGPIEEIYQRQLVPRLDHLPTRQQRDAATRRSESQPASQAASP